MAQALIAAVGWRHAYVLLGLMAMGVAIPVVGLLLKETPQLIGQEPDGDTVGQAEVSKAARPGGRAKLL